jgi:hypothetical protein
MPSYNVEEVGSEALTVSVIWFAFVGRQERHIPSSTSRWSSPKIR